MPEGRAVSPPPGPTGAGLARLNGASAGRAALAYAELGWPVVPVASMAGGRCGCRAGPACEHPAKHPLVPGGTRGASTDPAQLAEWFSHWPGAGVGVLTGAVSGLVVVDVDPVHGGRDSLARLRQGGTGLPRTLYARSGGGGWHLFYRRPGVPVRNATGRLGTLELPGVDLRADGGYVVAAPSGHRSGGRYAWHDGPEGLAPLPAWVAQRRRDWGPVPEAPGLPGGGRLSAYAAAALDSECRRVASAPEGLRSDQLNRAAFSLGTLVGAGALAEADVVVALATAAAAASQAGSTPLGAREAMATIRSGLREGMRRPRQLDRQ
ncbi:MAG TPA: bifunctional DNA primase/polymerase [Acidimicrobiales bacterium]|nr:bifunctional DNA primase/polymerase [Acidimicrobiales bacterium]